MRLFGALLIGLLLPVSAAAKSWDTPAACEVTHPAIHAESIAPLTEPELVAAGQDVINGTGRLWQITTPEGAVSHLWGTYHTTDRSVLDLPDQVKGLINTAKTVMVEVDFTFKTRREIARAREYPGWWRPDYSNFVFSPRTTGLPHKIVDWVEIRLIELGFGQTAANHLTLAAIANLLLTDRCDDFKLGTIPIQDSLIQTLGHIAGAQIIGLEGPNDLMTHLTVFPETALAMIKVYGSYLDPDATIKERATSIALYRRGLIGSMIVWDAKHISDTLGKDGREALKEADAYLLEQRNLNWLPTLVTQLDAGGGFVAVGSFHLPGPTGLVELFRARGYKVERIPLPGEDT